MNLFDSRLRRTTAALAGAFIGIVGAVAFNAAPASAHAPSVTGKASCLKDGSWKIDWLFGNDFRLKAWVREIKLDPQVTLEGKITDKDRVIPKYSAYQLAYRVPGSSTVAANVDSVHIEVYLKWADGYVNYKPAEAVVARPATCVPPVIPPSSTPPSSTPPSSTPPSSTPPSSTPPSSTPPSSTPPSSTPPSSTPPSSTPPTSPTVPPVPQPEAGEPNPILEMDCTSLTIGLDNPANGIEIPLHFVTSKGETRDTVIKPGERKVEKFSATPGFSLKVSVKGYESDTETIPYTKPADCDTQGGGAGGGLPLTGAAAGTIAGGAAALLAAGGVLFFLARRRKVKFTA
ncbi:LPXTG cell wall anchor domain-containing protein [Krasilnikovia sp. MM14-A1259]|uniref:LPXTG cell wall anchor domain-containing protein n=1 Tax=Krasilnikovia sp. MM14-A1259 TaxID=3373539 RepID=UPI003810EE13